MNLSPKVKVFLLMCICVVLPLSFATNRKADVFVTQKNHVIQLGSLVKTLNHNVPVYVYYNQQTDYVYYTWFDTHTHKNVVKVYYRYAKNTNNYVATYYGKIYKPYQ